MSVILREGRPAILLKAALRLPMFRSGSARSQQALHCMRPPAGHLALVGGAEVAARRNQGQGSLRSFLASQPPRAFANCFYRIFSRDIKPQTPKGAISGARAGQSSAAWAAARARPATNGSGDSD
jgi:hypothetical protein